MTSMSDGSPSDEKSRVSLAFDLGWQVAELFYQPSDEVRAPGVAAMNNLDRLPRIGELGSDELLTFRLSQIRDGFSRLQVGFDEVKPLIDARMNTGVNHLPATTAPGPVGDLQQSGVSGRDSDVAPSRQLAEKLHRNALIALTASDSRLGKGYSLGCALAEVSLEPRQPDQPAVIPRAVYIAQFSAARLGDVYASIADLKTVLPDHTAYAVSWSLRQWQWWVARAGDGERWDEVDDALARQGQQWRSLLSGERLAKDLLTAMSFVDAAKGLSARLGRTIGAFVSRYKGFVAGAAVLLLALFGGLSYWSVQGENGKAAWAAITAVVGLVGGWRGISGTLGRSLSQVETPLWDAELDGVIAERVVHLPPGATVVPQTPEEVGVLQGDVQPHPLWIDPDSFKVGATLRPYNEAIRVRGGTPPYRVKLKRSFRTMRNHFPLGFRRLPPGFQLRALRQIHATSSHSAESDPLSTLWVSGKPSRSSVHTVRVHVNDSSNPIQYARRHLLIEIRESSTETESATPGAAFNRVPSIWTITFRDIGALIWPW